MVAKSNTKNVIKAVMLFMVSRAGVVAGAEGGVYLSPVCIMTVYGCLTPQVALSAVNLLTVKPPLVGSLTYLHGGYFCVVVTPSEPTRTRHLPGV